MKSIAELWTPVLINDGIFKDTYIVSNLGRVKRKRKYRDGSCQFILVKNIDSKRPVVKMSGGGKRYCKSVAKLVLSSFQYRNGCEYAKITYLDGDMKNCALSNLRYAADKLLYTNVELDNKKPEANANVKPKQNAVLRSCSSCEKNPCFEGMANLSTDFGAIGCRKYKLKETDK